MSTKLDHFKKDEFATNDWVDSTVWLRAKLNMLEQLLTDEKHVDAMAVAVSMRGDLQLLKMWIMDEVSKDE